MTKQKKIAEPETKEEEYKTPLQKLLSFLMLPHKIYRDIYISVVERRLSSRPLVQNEESIAYLAQQVGIEPALMSEKIKAMVRMKWIELEQVGDRDTNQLYVLSPVWRYRRGIDKVKFAIALQEYRVDIKKDMTHQMSTRQIYHLMHSVCLHTGQKRDKTLCALHRWTECEICVHNKEERKENV